ncbi:hypothetical protein ANN_27195 [Periplaneta americana]|uniref:G-protein coupled receptors family 1 profile domain-containing protein n=1 Tax=Periplaneta americana TaxID=6978 RepID=A0ABQ8RXD8_PERAM|nr:hypothetical protein ANN_27195 [Periplaneta americana]
MRSERNKIFLNLAICDILSIVCNACIQILYIYGGSYHDVFIYYRIIDLTFEVMIGVSIYTIVALSIQRYLAVSAVNKCNECGVTRYCNSTMFICCLWFIGCLPQVIYIATDITPRSWIIRNLILYCLIPIVATATFYVMTSVRLRKSVHKMPGKVTGQESARSARVHSFNVLIALIIIFIVSYAPIQLFRFLEIWFYGGDYLFDYVDLLAYSLLSLNSCFNPIALYVASGTFRRYYNMYLCCIKEKQDTNLSRSDQKQQSTVHTIVLQSTKVDDWKV